MAAQKQAQKNCWQTFFCIFKRLLTQNPSNQDPHLSSFFQAIW